MEVNGPRSVLDSALPRCIVGKGWWLESGVSVPAGPEGPGEDT